MRTHMDVQEGYRPFVVTVKASGAQAAPDGQIAGPPEAGPVERYAPGMGYPGDEGGGPPDSRVDAPAGRRGDQREGTGRRRARGGESGYSGETGYPGRSSGSHRRPDGASSPGAGSYRDSAGSPDTSGSYPGIARSPDPTSPDSTGSSPGYPGPAGPGYPGAMAYAPPAPEPGTRRGTGRRGREPAGGSDPGPGAGPPAQAAPPALGGGPPSRENAWRRPERRPGQEIQGGSGNSPASSAPQPRGSLWSAGAFRTAGPGGRGPVRGFPPAPGAPDPVYPPGQFSPWNASALRAASAAGRAGLTAGPGSESSEPGYSQLAVSDPSADATATQTWVALDDAHLEQLDEWGTAAADAPAGSGWDQSGHSLTGESDQTGPRGFFEPPANGAAPSGPVASAGALATPGFPAPAGAAAPSGYGSRDGTTGYPGETGFPGSAGFPGQEEYPGQPGFPGEAGHPGEPGYPGEAGDMDGPDPSLRAARPGGRLAARQGRQQGAQDFPAADAGPGTVTGPGPVAGGTRGSRSEARGRKPRKPRKPPSRARMWLMPLVMMVVVIVLITVAYLHFAKGQATLPVVASPARQATASSSASLGPWKHITTRAEDPAALSLAELFPARYSASGTVVQTIQRSGHNCPGTVLGNRLRAALRKAGCTQVMRASYLSAGQKIMATIGVLNLANVTDAERAGQATGATAFIKQLPGAHGPTKNLMKGTGLEEAQIKGHYLILTWAEFTNLRAPGSAARRAELDTFSRQLVASTAGISLTSRMVFGKPETP
jgi:hypothetical protein